MELVKEMLKIRTTKSWLTVFLTRTHLIFCEVKITMKNEGHLIYSGFNINLIKFLTMKLLTYNMLLDASINSHYNAVS